ncbi:serine hydrolase [Lentzea sp. NPDC058436]|uniref:serine hydrolase n=1 Tax=Lentzea sp. NPDC058436 TaxID=3346499 RepID=UPI003661D5B5
MDQTRLQQRLDELCETYVVPGATAAVLRDGVVTSAASGIANLSTGLPVRQDTLFAAGSITKVFTCSLLMTCVDEGLVGLDDHVTAYLPDFRVGDGDRSSRITVRMLLNHTCGLAANFMPAQRKGPHVLTEFVRLIEAHSVVGEPGGHWSYSNAGTVTAGAVIEAATGRTWDEALEERILRPLGLNATTDTDRMILQSTAVGHEVDPGATSAQRSDLFQIAPGMAPAGSTLFCDVHALIAFARMHLAGGVAADGRRVLSREATELMRARSVDTMWGFEQAEFGLGWHRRPTPAGPVVGHGGGNIGQISLLETLPDQQGALAVLTNGNQGALLVEALKTEVLQECFGVAPFVRPTPSGEQVEIDLEPFTGRYEAPHGTATVRVVDGHLQAEIEDEEMLARWYRTMRHPSPPAAKLIPTGEPGRFLAEYGPLFPYVPAEFREYENGSPTLFRYIASYERV